MSRTIYTAADLVEQSVSETLTYYTFPDIHWQKIRTNNWRHRFRSGLWRRFDASAAVATHLWRNPADWTR